MPTSFGELKEKVLANPVKKRMGVVAAEDEHTLDAVIHACRDGIAEPVLIGDGERIFGLWKKRTDLAVPEIHETENTEESVQEAMRLVREGELDCIMKGRVETGALMKAVVNKEKGIGGGGVLSLVALVESPNYHKLFAVTDVGLLIRPNLSQKREVIKNAVTLMHAIGVEEPKVAVLAALEKAKESMPETMDAAELKAMQERGEIEGCIVEGPISYDLCMDPEAAAIKGYESPVAGDADVLVVPEIVSGNILSKSLTCTGGAKTCGSIVGAKVPIILTSRSASMEDKYMSIVLSALVGDAVKV